MTGGTASRLGYEGKEHDRIVGDTDFKARKYCVDLGIFCQPDSLITNIYNPQALNRYSFELNNPYKYTDPTGHYVIGILAKVLYRALPFLSDLAISATVSSITDEQKKKYEETIPEEERSEFVEGVYQFTRGGGIITDSVQGGMVLSAKTRHVYLRNAYKFLDDVGDVGIIVDAILASYYAYKTHNYNPSSVTNEGSPSKKPEVKIKRTSSGGGGTVIEGGGVKVVKYDDGSDSACGPKGCVIRLPE